MWVVRGLGERGITELVHIWAVDLKRELRKPHTVLCRQCINARNLLCEDRLQISPITGFDSGVDS